MDVTERNLKKRRMAALSLLLLPVLLSLFGAGGALASFLDRLLRLDGDAAVATFRANISVEVVGALFSLLAFLLMLRYAADRSVRVALVLLSVAELYMLVYWTQSYLLPDGRPFLADVLGSSALLLAVIVCCYAWSLLLGNNRLCEDERAWMIFVYVSYILSFVAFYAPMWQRSIPEAAIEPLLSVDSPVYILAASLLNVMRCVALKHFVFSSLFVARRDGDAVSGASYFLLNRYVIAVMLATIFIIYGLALVCENAGKLL